MGSRSIEYFINSLTVQEKLFLTSAFSFLLMFFLSFYILVISPMIFKFIVIPEIEEKIKKPLGHHPLLDCIFLGKWIGWQNEIAVYTINRYYAWKVKKEKGLPKYCNRFALKKEGYTIDMMSKKEIVFSFLLVAIWILMVIFGVIGFSIATFLKLT